MFSLFKTSRSVDSNQESKNISRSLLSFNSKNDTPISQSEHPSLIHSSSTSIQNIQSQANSSTQQINDTKNDIEISPSIHSNPAHIILEPMIAKVQIFNQEIVIRFILKLILYFFCVILEVSPLIFFILGSTGYVPEFASVSKLINNGNENDKKYIKIFADYPSIRQLCIYNEKDCIRCLFFLSYLIVFLIMFVFCAVLFIIRKDIHPLRYSYVFYGF